MASLVEAICIAERDSTGEIRIHIDTQTTGNNAEKALETFQTLGMTQTQDRNAVLFHINFSQSYLTILGDQGIHRYVKQEFWDQMHDRITARFAKKEYYDALYQEILNTGQELKKYFPHNETTRNQNELSNEISFSH